MTVAQCDWHTHTCKLRTKCPAPLCLYKPRLPHVSETTGDRFFCSLLFPLISFVGYCRRLVWVSLMCVRLCGRGRGEGESGTSRGMSFLQSLHFGIRAGSGLNRGNMTSSSPSALPLSSYFFSFSLFLPLSVPPPFAASLRPPWFQISPQSVTCLCVMCRDLKLHLATSRYCLLPM